jgi:hypothetical protein
MRLTFTKRDGKHDELTISRTDGRTTTIQCPKQGIIPHDMVHFAVESTLARRGFFALIEEAEDAGYRVTGGDAEEAVERLVECFQAEMWGGRVPAGALLDTYALACDARSHKAVGVSAEDVEAVRSRLDQLTRRWKEVPLNGSLLLELG